MPIVKILNRDYQIACGEGEEKRLIELADRLDRRLRDMQRNFRGASESLVIMLTALTMEDNIEDLSSGKHVQNNNPQLEQEIDSLNKKVESLIKSLS